MDKQDHGKAGVYPVASKEAAEFLYSHSPLANADLVRCVQDGTGGVKLLGSYDQAGLTALAGVRTAPNPAFDHVVWVECSSAAACLALLAAAPAGRLYVKVHDDSVATWLEAEAGVRVERRDVYFAVDRGSLVSEPTGDACILSSSAVSLFPTPPPPAAAVLDVGDPDSAVWGIERSGCIVCSAVCGSVARTPEGGIGAIAALHTEKPWRRRGLATQLVGAATGALMAENCHVLYWTTPDNASSQRVATRLGYLQIHRVTEFLADAAWAHQQLASQRVRMGT